MSVTPITPALVTGLGADESKQIEALEQQLLHFNRANVEAHAYYEAKHELEFPGVTIPQEVASRVAPVVGAPGTVVDVLDERLEFLGWDDLSSGGGYGLQEIYDANELDAEAPMVHLDALIFGTAFARVGAGEGDEPLITFHSSMKTTGVLDAATRRLSSAWTVLKVEDGETVRGVLDLPDVSVTVVRRQQGWVVEDVDEHGLGRVPVVQFANRTRTSRRGGRSEITRAIRSLTEDMMRATLGMNVNTMFYSIPQLMILGRGPEAFRDRNGNPVPGWKILAGHALAINKDDQGETPKVQQLSMASPAPFIEQLREFRLQIASEAGLPAEYMGIQTANTSSADAIRMSESRLVKRTERRQSGFGRSWMEVARLALLVRDGEIPVGFDSDVAPDWMPAATPTRAATADETVKLIGASVFDARSGIVRKRLSLSRAETRLLEEDHRRVASRELLALSAAGGAARDESEDAKAARDKFEALGVAIRAGVDPEDAARRVGLSGVQFTGAVPVALRMPESQSRALEDK